MSLSKGTDVRVRLLSLLFLCGALDAATLTVDTTSDANFNLCTAAPGDCSLRGAINNANGTAIADTIAFNIPTSEPGCVPATGVCQIAPTSALTEIFTGDLIFDGYTQPGAQPNTNTPDQGGSNAQLKIVLSGSACVSCSRGIGYFTTGGTVRGMVINGFLGVSAIDFAGRATVVGTVEGCFIGTDVTGNIAVPNASGVAFGGNPFGGDRSQDGRVGGLLPAQRNVISGNLNQGIVAAGVNHRILGNLIGTNAAGNAALANATGILLAGGQGFFQLVGGVDVASRNTISGNTLSGISVGGSEPTNGTRIRGNFIGTDVTGSLAVGNGNFGIELSQGSGASQPALMGGTLAGEGNLIAFNNKQGVATRNIRGSVLGNRFFDNGQLGIAGGAGDNGSAGGRRANDPGDPDNPPNNGQNFPEIDLLSVTVGEVMVSYRVDSAITNSVYPLRVEFFRASGDEGAEFLGAQSYTAADAQLSKSVILTQPNPPIVLGEVIVATATDADGNTSEFSFSPNTLGIENPTLSACTNSDGLFCNGFESGAQASLRVRANALAAGGAFPPKGAINVSDDRGHSRALNLEPTNTALQSTGECLLIGSGASGPITISASLNTFKSAFGSASGGNATASASFSIP
ncbi:MAG: hypothetical protein SGI99_04425 [Pseudomonadota bacterium]|nr:hypothetical protein [Pseudomonadota bacterium]